MLSKVSKCTWLHVSVKYILFVQVDEGLEDVPHDEAGFRVREIPAFLLPIFNEA